MKKILVILALCLLTAYLGFSIFYFTDKPKEGLCKNLELVIKNANDNNHFVDTTEIIKLIKKEKLYPVGKQIKDVNTSSIEEVILKSHFIKKVQAYITDNGAIKVNIIERTPVLRVIPNQGTSYYLDSDGEIMPLSKYTRGYLPIASGNVKESFAKSDLYKFALFLSEDKFWNAQIEQIVVDNNDNVTLIPRVGNQQIILGSIENHEEKLDKLFNFYKGNLNEMGWNKYSTINLKFDKQVVCTKR